MSLLLNVALFLRKNPLQLKLSAIEKLTLYTFAARIGSNEKTWISQSELCKEMDIHISTLKRSLAKLVKLDLILITKQWRNNQYSFNENIVLTAQPRAMKEESSQLTSELSDQVSQLTSELLTAHQRAMTNDNSFSTALIPYGLEGNEKVLKETYKLTIKNKDTKKEIVTTFPNWLPEQDWLEFLSFRKSMKAPMGEVAQKRAISALERFHDTGQDVSKIIDQSIVNGWKGLFPLKGNFNGTDQKYNNLTRRQATMQRTWDAINNWH